MFSTLRPLAALGLFIIVGVSLAACSREEPPPITYLSLGDSLAVGVGASDPVESGYAPRYREILEDETGREVNLVQLGASGETSESFVASQLPRAAEVLRENPSAVVTLSLGANDLLQTRNASDAARRDAVAGYAENLDLILSEISETSNGRAGVTVLTLYNPAPGDFTDEWTARLNEETERVSRRNGATVADGYERFRGRESEYVNLPKDFHPTDSGYRALADALRDSRRESA